MKKYFFIQSIETSLCLCEDFDVYFGPKWSKKGKRWENLDEVKHHLKKLKEKRIPVSPFWEVVLYEKGEKERFPAAGLI